MAWKMESVDNFLNVASSFVGSPAVLSVFAVVLLTMVASFVMRKFFVRLEVKVEKTPNYWDDALLKSVRKPAVYLIRVVGICWAAEIILSESDSLILAAIDPARYVAVIVLLGIFINRLILESEKNYIRNAIVDETTATAISKLLRISVLITIGLMILQTLGVSISGILAFGGIGGIVVGFAAKDLLANLFGGLMLYLDRPFVVGEWIRSPDKEIEGTVESIGWRLTKIRTFDQRPLYVPNSTFTSISVENPDRQHNRRIRETIGIRSQDAAKMDQIVIDVKDMLINDPDIESERRILMVNFNSFAPSSLDFFIYTFTKTTDWAEYHAVKHRVLLEMLNITEGHGAEIAFPTSTIQFESSEQDSGQSSRLSNEIDANIEQN
ncbi:MAG: mechanosensitive ion channel family protein [Pseudomonadales bacterium]|nr:mechanosensitive ion channel family protein [Pseudomonadales bacterium]MDP7359656.1 mechanosensitive ion channel family protein [Pseudomonadales bacterium]